MAASDPVTRIAAGEYLVQDDDEQRIVYVAGGADRQWAFWNGQVFEVVPEQPAQARSPKRPHVAQSLSAPMPATVVRVLVKPGAAVKKGDTIVVLEAMKMELPVRAPGDAIVKAVHCREGELVQPDATLVELE